MLDLIQVGVHTVQCGPHHSRGPVSETQVHERGAHSGLLGTPHLNPIKHTWAQACTGPLCLFLLPVLHSVTHTVAPAGALCSNAPDLVKYLAFQLRTTSTNVDKVTRSALAAVREVRAVSTEQKNLKKKTIARRFSFFSFSRRTFCTVWRGSLVSPRARTDPTTRPTRPPSPMAPVWRKESIEVGLTYDSTQLDGSKTGTASRSAS